MNRKTLVAGLFLGLALSTGAQKIDIPSVVKAGTKLEKLAGGFAFTEGPAADAIGNLFFTDQPNDRIMEWSINDELSTFMQPSGRSNGMFFDAEGNLVTCADEKNEIWKISPDKKREIILKGYEGKLLNGPNDLWIAPDGSIFFTDPFYRRDWWDHSVKPQDKECVYYLGPDQKTLKRVIDDLAQPNGIIGTPDGKTLYVADIRGNKTWSYAILPGGVLTDKRLFCDMGSDGMTIDKDGNVYLTGKGVTIFDKRGKKLGNIPVPENWTANVCFGGRDRKSLFITASNGLYRIRTVVRGVY